MYRFDLNGGTADSIATLVKNVADKIAKTLGVRPRITSFDDGVILLRLDDRMTVEVNGSGAGDMWDAGYKICLYDGIW